MIFKIAHICYCGDVFKAKKQLRILGYKLFFSEMVRPMGITQSHLSGHVDELSMSLWARPGGISIELLEFENYSQNEGLISPLFPAKMHGVVTVMDEEKTSQLNKSEYLQAVFLDCPAYIKRGSRIDGPLLLDSFLLFSIDVRQSVHFWCTFGFACVESSNMHGILRFRCAFTGKDFFMHIHKFNQEAPIQEDIDSPGFHVIGLISNSASQERKKMISSGIEVTPIEQITINEKRLTIFYARSPEGLITEIISLN